MVIVPFLSSLSVLLNALFHLTPAYPPYLIMLSAVKHLSNSAVVPITEKKDAPLWDASFQSSIDYHLDR